MSGKKAKKKINLALQGGGALGAFTWGVLDRLLEDDRIEIDAISGASAGAMNAVVLAEGLVEGGAETARKALRQFWSGVADAGENNPYFGPLLNRLLHFQFGEFGDLSEAWIAPWRAVASAWMNAAGPYNFNPLNLNPLEDLLDKLVDFDRVRSEGAIDLFLTATNVETGRARIFTNSEMTPKHVIASACLPQLFQAVEIDGHYYWDGGYMGNPPLYPLFDGDRSKDIVIVQINPIERKGVPRTAEEINARINEVTFNASLLRELRAIEFVARLLDEGRLENSRYKKMLIHCISDDSDLLPLGAGAKTNTHLEFFESLFGFGRAACESWMKAHWKDLGVASTVDLREMFSGEIGPTAPDHVASLLKTDSSDHNPASS